MALESEPGAGSVDLLPVDAYLGTALVGGIALVLAMPITTALGVLVAAGAVPATEPPRESASVP